MKKVRLKEVTQTMVFRRTLEYISHIKISLIDHSKRHQMGYQTKGKQVKPMEAPILYKKMMW